MSSLFSRTTVAFLAGVGTTSILGYALYKKFLDKNLVSTGTCIEQDEDYQTPMSEHNFERDLKAPTEETDTSFVADIPENKVLLLGLQGCGKTSILAELAHDEAPTNYDPTKGFNVVCLTTENTNLSIWEIGGAQQYRSYWKNFLSNTCLVVFVVDSSDSSSFDAATLELSLLTQEEVLSKIPFIIVASKQDKENSKTPKDIETILDISSYEDRSVKCLGVNTKVGGAEESLNITELHEAIIGSLETH